MASETVPCVFIAGSASERHITPNATQEVKLDGYRAIAIKADGRVQLRSRNNKDFNRKYPTIAVALAALPDETVIDGEIVALDDSGRPSFNSLQNYGSASAPILYYVFDVLLLSGRDLMSEPLAHRRDLLRNLPAGKLSATKSNLVQ